MNLPRSVRVLIAMAVLVLSLAALLLVLTISEATLNIQAHLEDAPTWLKYGWWGLITVAGLLTGWLLRAVMCCRTSAQLWGASMTSTWGISSTITGAITGTERGSTCGLLTLVTIPGSGSMASKMVTGSGSMRMAGGTRACGRRTSPPEHGP